MTPRQRKQKRRLFLRKLNAAFRRHLDPFGSTAQVRGPCKRQHFRWLRSVGHWYIARYQAQQVAEGAVPVKTIRFRRTPPPKNA